MSSKGKNTSPQATVEEKMKQPNAWLFYLCDKIEFKRFSITLASEISLEVNFEEGDGVVVSDGITNGVIAFARIYRIRKELDKTTFYFDGVLPAKEKTQLDTLGLPITEGNTPISRMEWPIFEHALKTVCGIVFENFPVLIGESLEEKAYIRELLRLAVVDDLLGPAGGPEEEIVGMSVRDRYLVGKLAPIEHGKDGTTVNPFTEEDIEDGEEPSDLAPCVNDEHVPIDKKVSIPDNEDDEEEREIDASTNQSLVPSSVGFTFCVNDDLENLQLTTSWARYEKTQSEEVADKSGKPKRCWKRIPSCKVDVISLKNRVIKPFSPDIDCPDVVIQGSVSEPLSNGNKLVTLFLINRQTTPDQNQDRAWIFQPEMMVRDVEGKAVFQRKPYIRENDSDDEVQVLEMLYRKRVEFAVGHGISIHATVSEDDPERATEVRTAVLPEYELQVTETPGLDEGDRPTMRKMIETGFLDMDNLAEMERDELISGLKMLTDDYAAWITERKSELEAGNLRYRGAAVGAMDQCEAILDRLREGIDVLNTDGNALQALRFANRTMASQRIHGIFAQKRRRGEDVKLEDLNKPDNKSWRSFQLAFILLSIPALANPTHKDRTQPLEAFADLLWFPTGGGKTEAYLGVAAFAMAIRRLQGNLGGLDGGRGLAVIMRYTLRLLTLQQFQRATTMMCAMEIIRRSDTATWGVEPFTLGLWVGQKVTPNTTEDSHSAIEKERDKRYTQVSSPAQLTTCPWCGSEIDPGSNIKVDKELGRTYIYCGAKYDRCEFSQTNSPLSGLPVSVVDEEIYHRPPSMLIATVDKFAMMAWRGQVRTLFGKTSGECPRHGLLWPEAECKGNHPAKGKLPSVKFKAISQIRPPDLIVQDEFHLISGPLGTMVGLYETAVDELSTWTLDGKTVRPKIIASTATIRKAEEQVNDVFLRRVSVFPPSGINVEDNFFSLQRPIEDKPGRLYLGICSPGSARPAVLIRVYVALLAGAQRLFEKFGQAADPYMTLVGYFNSLRELGGMRRLAEDDVQTRSYRVEMSDVKRPGLKQRAIKVIDELTSRVSSREIPRKLDQLELEFKERWEKNEARAIDIVLATNMLSVGVDVPRLGLMAVNGQPKNTAEYIQATSRVGRSHPGLVCTVLTWSRPRDLSHYETFEHYHASFYKHVEAQSVTPFAPRALDRGLTGAMVSLLRLENEELNPNEGAQALDSPVKDSASKVREVVSERAWKVKDKTAKTTADSMAAERIDKWVKEAIKPGRSLGYEKRQKRGDLAALLKKPGASAWDEFTVPMSMREVEPGVRLVMDDSMYSTEPPPWKLQIVKKDGGEDE